MEANKKLMETTRQLNIFQKIALEKGSLSSIQKAEILSGTAKDSSKEEEYYDEEYDEEAEVISPQRRVLSPKSPKKIKSPPKSPKKKAHAKALSPPKTKAKENLDPSSSDKKLDRKI